MKGASYLISMLAGNLHDSTWWECTLQLQQILKLSLKQMECSWVLKLMVIYSPYICKFLLNWHYIISTSALRCLYYWKYQSTPMLYSNISYWNYALHNNWKSNAISLNHRKIRQLFQRNKKYAKEIYQQLIFGI